MVTPGGHGPNLTSVTLCRIRVMLINKCSLMVNLITDDRYCSILVITVSNIFTLQKHEHTLKKYYCQPSSLSLNKIISSRELCSCHHYWMYLIWICHCIKYNLLFQLILIFFSSTNFFLPQSVLYSFQLIVPYLNPMRLLLFSFLLLNEKKNSWKSKGKSSSFQFTAFRIQNLNRPFWTNFAMLQRL